MHRRSHRNLGIALAICLAAACERPTDFSEQTTVSEPAAAPAPAPAPAPELIDTGDLDAILGRGFIRLLRPRWDGNDGLPRSGLPAEAYQRLAERFAASIGVEHRWVPVARREELDSYLAEGRGDVVVTNFTITRQRQETARFTLPLVTIDEWIVASSERSDPPASLDDLSRYRIAVPEHSSYLDSFESSAALQGIEPVLLESSLSGEEILDLLAAGEFDLTIMDSNSAEAMLATRDDVEHVLTLPGERQIGWAMRKENPELDAALNLFLIESHIADARVTTYVADLEEIKNTGRIRMLTVNGAITYFLWRGELVGFEYDLARRFAESLGVELEVVLAPSYGDLIPWLLEGRGDFVAAAMTITQDRIDQGVRFSRFYQRVNEVFVSHKATLVLKSLQDLEGRTVVANPASSYWQTLTKLKQGGIALELVPTDLSTEQILEAVADGQYPITLADSHLVDLELAFSTTLDASLRLDETRDHGWAVHPDNDVLIGSINTFFKREYRGLTYNVLRQKYFTNKAQVAKFREARTTADSLSPFDDYARTYAERYDFDWRLVVSQMYQESRFDPDAKSFAGAVGLLQLLPRTASEFGFDAAQLSQPEVSINAGTTYLNWVRDRFPSKLSLDERLWFTLAAYNAGTGHVRDARRLARRQGWNPDQWFDSVEDAMLLLSKPAYARQARFGYVRGREPVNYVRSIRDRYQAYLALEQ